VHENSTFTGDESAAAGAVTESRFFHSLCPHLWRQAPLRELQAQGRRLPGRGGGGWGHGRGGRRGGGRWRIASQRAGCLRLQLQQLLQLLLLLLLGLLLLLLRVLLRALLRICLGSKLLWWLLGALECLIRVHGALLLLLLLLMMMMMMMHGRLLLLLLLLLHNRLLLLLLHGRLLRWLPLPLGRLHGA
jgi:hypothetical protein